MMLPQILSERMQRAGGIAQLEVLTILRDRSSLSLVLLLPIVQILLFGYAVNLDPRDITVAISGDAPELLRAIEEDGRFKIVASALEPGEPEQRVRSGEVHLAMELSEFPRLIVDGSDPTAVRPAVLALQAAAARTYSGIDTEVQWLYNPDALGSWAIAPGLIGVIVMISMLLFGAMTLVREREQGSWDSLLATRVTALEIMTGILTPYLVLAILQALAVTALAHALFDLPLRGSLVALLFAVVILALTHLAFGFALSALARTQLQAVQGAVFFYLPSMLLSGFMFPFEGMPRWARAIGDWLPLTHFVRTARGVLLRGESFAFAWFEMRSALMITVLTAALAALLLRKRLG